MFAQPEIEAPLTVIRLSNREVEVLRMISEGLTSRQVAEILFLSTRTVNFHLARVYSKLGVNNRIQAIVVAGRLGLIRTEQLFGNGRDKQKKTEHAFAPDGSAGVESDSKRMRMHGGQNRSP